MFKNVLRFIFTAGIVLSFLFSAPMQSVKAAATTNRTTANPATSSYDEEGGGGGTPRYVSTTGSNVGTCLNLAAPCLTIAYAISKSSLTGADQIRIAAGTYYENLTIDRPLSLIGAGQNQTFIDSGVAKAEQEGGGGLALVTINSGVTAALLDLNVQNGFHPGGDGGGINNNGSLTLIRVSITGGTAINGGGIFNNGSLNISDVFIKGNSAIAGGKGGGLYNKSYNVSLANVTFIENIATLGVGKTDIPEGGGTSAAGGGIFDESGTSIMRLTNVTITNNTAVQGGAIMVETGTNLIIKNSTIANNQATYMGGILNYGSSISLVNTIVHGNNMANCAADFSGTFTSLGNNIDGGATCLTPAVAQPSDHASTNPLLLPLGKNGGYVPTMALQATSPAIDAANPASCPARDAAVRPRPQDGNGDGSSICDIGAFEAPATSTFTSTALHDGWLLESSETSEIGGSTNNTATTFNIGDDAAKKQYRGVLSFNTSAIPDSAIITGVTLKIKQQAIVGTGNPFTLFNGLMIDMKNGFFGTFPAPQISDFQAVADGSYGPTNPTAAANVYSISLTNGKAHINKLAASNGLTQIRLRFKLDDNNNAIANYISLYSGDAATAADRPQLVVTYIMP